MDNVEESISDLRKKVINQEDISTCTPGDDLVKGTVSCDRTDIVSGCSNYSENFIQAGNVNKINETSDTLSNEQSESSSERTSEKPVEVCAIELLDENKQYTASLGPAESPFGFSGEKETVVSEELVNSAQVEAGNQGESFSKTDEIAFQSNIQDCGCTVSSASASTSLNSSSPNELLMSISKTQVEDPQKEMVSENDLTVGQNKNADSVCPVPYDSTQTSVSSSSSNEIVTTGSSVQVEGEEEKDCGSENNKHIYQNKNEESVPSVSSNSAHNSAVSSSSSNEIVTTGSSVQVEGEEEKDCGSENNKHISQTKNEESVPSVSSNSAHNSAVSSSNEIVTTGSSVQVEGEEEKDCGSENNKHISQTKNEESVPSVSSNSAHNSAINPNQNENLKSMETNQIEDSAPEETVKSTFAIKDSDVRIVLYGNIHSSFSHYCENEVTTLTSNASCKNPLVHDYRDSSDSSSVTDLSSSSEDESITEVIDLEEDNRKATRRHDPICRGEFLLSDLPPIEDLNISVPEEECIKIGVISSLVGELAVIQSLPNIPALDLDSVLFLNHGRTSLGKIFDVLGQVKEPFYTVRFNSELHALERGVAVGTDVYCAPKSDHTAYIFVSEMMKMKGSDASWEHNNEPPSVCLDYSDDEEERLARRALANQKHGDDKDNGPPRKKRGVRQKMGNSNQFNNRNQRGSFADNVRPEVSPARECFPPSIPQPTTCPPVFPPRSVYPHIDPRRLPPPCSPPVMFGTPPPNFRHPLRTGFNSSLFGVRNFQPSLAPPRLPPQLSPSINNPFFIRPFHVLPPVPLVPLPHLPPLPPYVSSPHVRPLLCPPHFQPHMGDREGPGSL